MNMKERIISEFKYACKTYLSTLSISRLRTYGRSKGVAQPTTMKKEDLIDLTIAILVGEVGPQIRNNKGAPIKDKEIDPKIDEEINRIYYSLISKYQGEIGHISDKVPFKTEKTGLVNDVKQEIVNFQQNQKFVLEVEDSNALQFKQKKYKGQLQVINSVAMLLPLHGKGEGERIILPIECIRQNDLREGDVLSVYAIPSRSVLVVTEVLTINGQEKESITRGRFEDLEVCYPEINIDTYIGIKTSLTAKYLQWLLPIKMGQRGCVLSSPKTGKTSFLFDLLNITTKSSKNITVFGLLVGQSLENVMPFRKLLSEEQLVFTTYEDEPEQQVFSADFMLNRAKRLAESGQDVLLVVDSLNNLAKAFNETESSVGGKTLSYGLESKTLHYIKKFFGAARCFEKGGSLTIIASLSENTGNPVDDLLCADLLEISTLQIRLSEELARKRIYPSIDLVNSKSLGGQSDEEIRLDRLLRTKFLAKYSEETLRNILNRIQTLQELEKELNN